MIIYIKVQRTASYRTRIGGKHGVSRIVIREAIRIMVDNNVLELQDGCSYVRQLSFDEIVSNISKTVNPDAVHAQAPQAEALMQAHMDYACENLRRLRNFINHICSGVAQIAAAPTPRSSPVSDPKRI